jgi:HD-like signal output (HDOD) protein
MNHSHSSSQPNAQASHAKTSVQDILKSVRDIPALPQVVIQVVELLNKPNSNGLQIASLISYDPGLTSRILRMVNSSAYGIPRQVTSIQHSIAMLGYNVVRGLVLGASICQIFSSLHASGKTGQRMQIRQGLDLESFWRHALLMGFFSKHLADHFKLPEADDVFSAGMLHNIGILILYAQSPRYDIALHSVLKQRKAGRYGVKTLEIEQLVLGFTHLELGTELSQRWELPDLMHAVISRYASPRVTGEKTDAAVFVVALAHQLLSAMSEVQYHCEAITCKHLSPELLEYFQFKDDKSVQVLCDGISPLLVESREILKTLIGF